MKYHVQCGYNMIVNYLQKTRYTPPIWGYVVSSNFSLWSNFNASDHPSRYCFVKVSALTCSLINIVIPVWCKGIWFSRSPIRGQAILRHNVHHPVGYWSLYAERSEFGFHCACGCLGPVTFQAIRRRNNDLPGNIWSHCCKHFCG